MADAYFAALEQDGTGGRYAAAAATAGPWDPRLQHGGPPSALLVLLAERAARAERGSDDVLAVRYAAEFVGPVPVAEVEVTTRVVRVARSGVLMEAALSSGDRICLAARIWLVRDSDTSAVAHAAPERSVIAAGRGLGMSFPYADSLEWRMEHGSLVEPGPASVWVRPNIPVLVDCALSSLQRAVLVGDSASGVSAELSWTQWSFVNVDLDVHLFRPIVGDWLQMDAATQLGAHGAALARSTLADVAGPVGATAQTLVLTPRVV